MGGASCNGNGSGNLMNHGWGIFTLAAMPAFVIGTVLFGAENVAAEMSISCSSMLGADRCATAGTVFGPFLASLLAFAVQGIAIAALLLASIMATDRIV